MINKLGVTLAAMLLSGPVVAQTCAMDFDFVSPRGHDKAASSLSTLKKGFGAAAKSDFNSFMSIAADPYIQHSPDLPDGWKPVWDLLANRSDDFSSKQIPWLGAHGFFDNGNYLVMFREVDHGEGPVKKFDLLYFDADGLYAEHWDIAQSLSETSASGRSETDEAAEFRDNPVQYDQNTEESNRRLVVSFLNLGFNGGQLETAFNLHAAQNYIQHNPMVPDGTQALIDMSNSGKMPQLCYDIRFVLTQNDLVWVYSKVSVSDDDLAVVDLFRVRDAKIVEHWDVIQVVPDDMPHTNSMF